ncbi:group III truncated hemoglobin [Alloalcanivorax xenomutans]|uniref:Group III truncated hemoglobin n=1 Tax=Alloalcanivorax xenomutans TaxID=1094342 RepID=A0A9Q3W7B5_9GAMM|nr:group III truncated hemoglobin [Alloalcanivorax xenomutans]ERS13691.1 hypothetical protein Q668_14285 [Alcanivorax sp. PN-3]KYZ87247.1 globin [Alcanivorax sp. KX64203]MBA4723170.1 group III truncated hemoglobin [Alcanivorax sp.]MCE7509157.1 group III truncated hemoglobin [Alloalcanivorax xenomutans]MCE7522472.1 group III truncated hemoglobin [Alloalcanivorax xenomutans]
MSERQRVRLFQPGAAGHRSKSGRPDLDSPEQIDRMVSLFYQRILEDPLLAPVFLEVARIDLDEHLPLIAAFWKKLLLGDDRYNRHMMAKHRAVDDKMPLTGAHHERWLGLFMANLDQHFEGPHTDRARQLAARIIDNLYEQLSQRR